MGLKQILVVVVICVIYIAFANILNPLAHTEESEVITHTDELSTETTTQEDNNNSELEKNSNNTASATSNISISVD